MRGDCAILRQPFQLHGPWKAVRSDHLRLIGEIVNTALQATFGEPIGGSREGGCLGWLELMKYFRD
jgi:hypothetical protein